MMISYWYIEAFSSLYYILGQVEVDSNTFTGYKHYIAIVLWEDSLQHGI